MILSKSKKSVGKLFVFEGVDGVGKTSISKAVVKKLSRLGIGVDYLSFPGKKRGTLGFHIYDVHHNIKKFEIKKIRPEALQVLHIAAHIDSIATTILPALNNGKNIILDRYWWSTYVYGWVGGINRSTLDAMINLEFSVWGQVQPELVFLIDRESSLRAEEDVNLWQKLSLRYKELAGREKNNHKVEIINNDGRFDDAVNIAVNLIKKKLKQEDLKTVSNKQILLEKKKRMGNEVPPVFFSSISPAKPSEVFDTYWRFAAERQEIFFRRFQGENIFLTSDPVLSRYKFTNAYRASDRVSQFLIREVIYKGDQSPEEVFFRILLFKLFNKIDTWNLLKSKLGTISFGEFSFKHYDAILSKAMSSGQRIYSAAYIMASGRSSYGYKRKHANHLKLLETMMEEQVPYRIKEARSMQQVFELLISYPSLGDFLAYQFTIDINYSEITNFSEMDFVVPGPGALDGINKCFKDFGGLTEVEIIRLMADRQDEEFKRLGIKFKSLWGRKLQLIDCQNLFCEVDKYARIVHPKIKGISGRTRIKQSYRPTLSLIDYWYPPKWGINEFIKRKE